MSVSKLEKIVHEIIAEERLPLKSEHRFHPTRKWRFDFADVGNRIAIELEGGVWIGGRHTRGSGFRNDSEKYNAATILGWRVLRYCTEGDIINNFLKDYMALL